MLKLLNRQRFPRPRGLLTDGHRVVSRPLLMATLTLLAASTGPAMAQNGVSGAEAIDATTQMLRKRGFAPPSDSKLGYKDYIEAKPGPDGDMTRISLLIDANRQLMPTQTWQTMHPSYCQMQSRDARQAKKRLRFKLIRWREKADGQVRDQTTVYAATINSDTDIIAEQQGAAGSQLWSIDKNAAGASLNNLSPDYVSTVMARAWGDLAFTGRGMVGPCGDEQPEDDGPIQPRNGQWQIKLVSQSTQSCPARIARGIQNTLGGMQTDGNTQALAFADPFHPEPLLGQGPPVDWERRGMNSWHAVMEQAGGSQSSMVVTLGATVQSPTLITEKQVIDMDGFISCRTTADFELKWMGTSASSTSPGR